MNEKKSKMAIFAFILGIWGAVTSLCVGLGCPFALAAIIVGGIAKKHDPDNKQAKIGQLLGIVGTAISMVALIIFLTVIANNG